MERRLIATALLGGIASLAAASEPWTFNGFVVDRPNTFVQAGLPVQSSLALTLAESVASPNDLVATNSDAFGNQVTSRLSISDAVFIISSETQDGSPNQMKNMAGTVTFQATSELQLTTTDLSGGFPLTTLKINGVQQSFAPGATVFSTSVQSGDTVEWFSSNFGSSFHTQACLFVNPVPEPATMFGLGVAGVGLLAMRRRKRS